MAYLPFEMGYLTEHIKEKAEIELGETDETRESSLNEMRARLKEDVKLHCLTSDEYLLQFLRAKKFNVKNALTVLQTCFQMKKTYNDIFEMRDFEKIIRICEDKFISVLPFRDHDGAILFLIQLRYWKYSEVPCADIAHAVITATILCVYQHPATQVCGIKLIFDAKEMNLNHLLHIPSKILRIGGKAISGAAAARMKGFYIINEPIIFGYAWNIVKFALSEKLKKRVHFCSTNLKDLTRKINSSLLPEDIGGTLKYDNSAWIRFVKSQQANYYQFAEYGYGL